MYTCSRACYNGGRKQKRPSGPSEHIPVRRRMPVSKSRIEMLPPAAYAKTQAPIYTLELVHHDDASSICPSHIMASCRSSLVKIAKNGCAYIHHPIHTTALLFRTGTCKGRSVFGISHRHVSLKLTITLKLLYLHQGNSCLTGHAIFCTRT